MRRREPAPVGLPERVAQTQRRLATAFDLDAALVALSTADLAVLRELEHQMLGRFRAYDSSDDLRLVLAELHVKNKQGKKYVTTQMVNTDVVRVWATEALTEWFPGYTDFDDTLNAQFKVTHVGFHNDNPHVPRFEVSTVDGRDPRRFRMVISVVEEVAA